MLSFGIEYDFAFSIAFCSARLPPGSGPPSFAATMIARDSFEKSLPRFASAAPFLCLIDDHLLCPDMRSFPDQVEEQLVHARIFRQLGMERRDDETTRSDEHGLAVVLREHLDVGTDRTHARCPDEDTAERPLLAGQTKIRLEARHLAPVRVAIDVDVDEPEMVTVEHDHARARSQDGRLERTKRFVEPVQPHEPHECRGLTARDDESVESLELFRLAHLDDLNTEPPQHSRVLTEVALDRQNADFRRPLHELDSRCGSRATRLVAAVAVC